MGLRETLPNEYLVGGETRVKSPPVFVFFSNQQDVNRAANEKLVNPAGYKTPLILLSLSP